jgi:hypothetical protein
MCTEKAADLESSRPERLVKSHDRVRDIGEVFTPADTVTAMLNLLPNEIWQSHPSRTFLEPTCGDGNFLAAILTRKLNRISYDRDLKTLEAGTGNHATEFHALEALASIYAVDISVDNVIGGTPGHEIGARDRLITLLKDWHHHTIGTRLNRTSVFIKAATWIVDRNIIVGDMLLQSPDESTPSRNRLPLIEYLWNPERLSVKLRQTSLSEAIHGAQENSAVAVRLFDSQATDSTWFGKARQLHRAPFPAPKTDVVLARNCNGRRAD